MTGYWLRLIRRGLLEVRVYWPVDGSLPLRDWDGWTL